MRFARLAFRLGRFAEAIGCSREALRLAPTDPELHFILGYSLVNAAKQPDVYLTLADGESLLPETAIDISPRYTVSGGWVESLSGSAHKLSVSEVLTVLAMIHFRYVIRLSPDSPDALNNLAWLLATHPRRELRKGPEAAELAQRACALTAYSKPDMLGTLAAAYAETGRFDLALEIAEKAVKLSQSSGDEHLQAVQKQLIEMFRNRRPFRMELPGGAHD